MNCSRGWDLPFGNHDQMKLRPMQVDVTQLACEPNSSPLFEIYGTSNALQAFLAWCLVIRQLYLYYTMTSYKRNSAVPSLHLVH
jgi:hypothetical protein